MKAVILIGHLAMEGGKAVIKPASADAAMSDGMALYSVKELATGPEIQRVTHQRIEGNGVCPECGSDDTRQVYEYDGGKKVCAADQCDSCGHQWNVG